MPKFGEPIANLTVAVGREAVLTCIVEDLGAYKVAWLRVDTQTILTIHSHVITKNHRIGVSHSDHRTWYLHIKEIRQADRGWYMCQINTDPMKSQMGFLDVVVPPDILDAGTSTDMTVRENSSAIFWCAASGSPSPNITWKRENNLSFNINGLKTQTVDGPSFNISKVTRHHMGAYLCIASNGVPPTVSKRIRLSVEFAPTIQVEKQKQGVMEGDDVTLECLTEAFPKSVTYWTSPRREVLSKGSKFEPATEEVPLSIVKSKMKLTIRSVSIEDFGTYTCVSKNTLGEAEATVKLNQIPRPTTTVSTTLPTTTTSKPTTTTEPTTKAPKVAVVEYGRPNGRLHLDYNEIPHIPDHREEAARAGGVVKPGSLYEGTMDRSRYGSGSSTVMPCHLLAFLLTTLFI
ncbi:neuronal growth regulator 1 [Halyomorpha halys]|uniref:neuronal growth regulator 1 n=1 Tax=Halyomorpha halys TaxID=286706 RepID=UPI0034D15728